MSDRAINMTDRPRIFLRFIGEEERLPQLPVLLDLLRCMSGCMDIIYQQSAPKNKWKETYERRHEIKRMLDSGMTGCAIAHEIGIPKSTLYRHIKAIRAGA